MWISHVTRINDSSRTYQSVMAQQCMSHFSHVNESCYTFQWVISHICVNRVSQVNESWLNSVWVISCMWMSHVIRDNESCLTYAWLMSHMWMTHVTHVDGLTHVENQAHILEHTDTYGQAQVCCKGHQGSSVDRPYQPSFCWIRFWHVRTLTGGKVAKQNKFSSAYQLANIQIFCTG